MRRIDGKTALIKGPARFDRAIALGLAEELATIGVNDPTDLEAAEEVVNAVKAMGQAAIFW
ncbi:hypothetical protein D1BOALGB6SA_2044 [Olavius sp. associated proteobacterium Delta 1]|nr:hypothetical protein D1BOALGB6SA_2044 [Olavius sp. associated proteobacterium Delta 1]